MTSLQSYRPRRVFITRRGFLWPSALVASVCSTVVVCSPALGQAKPQMPPESDCATITDDRHKQLVELGQAKLAETWLKSGTGWLTSYAIGGEAKNPLRPTTPKSAEVEQPIRGFVFSSGWTCALIPSADPEYAMLKFRALSFRFNENGAGWTNPGQGGVVLNLLGQRRAGSWTLAPVATDDTIFPDGTTLSRPALQLLPPHDVWPQKPCRPPKLWTGQQCALAARR